MLSDKLRNVDISEDVTVVNKEGLGFDKRAYISDASTRFQKSGFMKKAQWRAIELAVGVDCLPCLWDMVGVDRKLSDACALAVAQGVVRHRLMKERNQRLG